MLLLKNFFYLGSVLPFSNLLEVEPEKKSEFLILVSKLCNSSLKNWFKSALILDIFFLRKVLYFWIKGSISRMFKETCFYKKNMNYLLIWFLVKTFLNFWIRKGKSKSFVLIYIFWVIHYLDMFFWLENQFLAYILTYLTY